MSIGTRDEREQLEGERDFLLRSLDDLEAERAAGDVDAESYTRLHDDYTARAAAVIRALRDGVDARPAAAPWSGRRRIVVAGVIVAFAVVAAVALASTLSARRAGELASGNEAARAVPAADDRRAELEAAVEQDQADVAARLALAGHLARNGDLPAALEHFDEAARIDPGNAEALAQGARVRVLVAERVPDPDAAAQLVAEARDRLDRAVGADPEYADAHWFRAIVLSTWYGENDAAVGAAQRYLVLAPDGPYSRAARDLLARLSRATSEVP